MVNLVEKIAESVTSSLGAKVNYGAPVVIGGVEAVPVSLVWFGFGGGSEPRDGSEESAGGGGGGGVSVPVGVYVPGADGPEFRPNLIALCAVSVPLVAAAGVALARVVKALKK